MKLFAYAIRDILTDQYTQPLYAPNVQAAIRNLGIQINSGTQDDIIALHPQQFEAYHVGEYETDTGVFTPKEKERISHLGSLKRADSAEKQQLAALRTEAIDLNNRIGQSNTRAQRLEAEIHRLQAANNELTMQVQEKTEYIQELQATPN